ncbi:MAG: hypothetical protein ACRCVT_12515 [Leadbetterella sp.]
MDIVLVECHPLVVFLEPISKIQLDNSRMLNYLYSYHERENKVLDTMMFAQIIENAKSVDTTLWRDTELSNVIVVKNRNEWVSKKKVIQKLHLTEKKQIKFYKKQINSFNSTDSFNRNIHYFSKPVFDNSNKFAVIQWDNGHSGLGGGGGVILFNFDGNSWKKTGVIMDWRY